MKRNVISFLNMKGGVCKTTLCKEIAYTISEAKNKKVLVIDMDPQSNCTQSFFEKFQVLDGSMLSDNPTYPSIQELYKKSRIAEINLENLILTLNKNLDIIPGALSNIFMERDNNSTNEQKLYNILDEHNLRKNYDYIFIDCPPTYSFYTVSSLLASDFYFIPVTPDAYSLLGVNLLQAVIEQIKDSYRSLFKAKPLDSLGIIFTKILKSGNKKEEDSKNKTQEKNILDIKSSIKDIDFFKNMFYFYPKLSGAKLETFIYDRNDTKIINNLESIVNEFIKKVEGFNSHE
ncbi:ParA family protein [Peptacetobacter sp. AB845]|uniref:ParA family protein n=1 Tax=Peptacetobacter sp. AB845 TaxID=3388429 RepID=UPI0039C8F670